jgi:hypothetical protein
MVEAVLTMASNSGVRTANGLSEFYEVTAIVRSPFANPAAYSLALLLNEGATGLIGISA